ncbi:MAG: IS3 family transposase [Gemmataceae bacterium]
MCEIHVQFKKAYGYRRVCISLHKEDMRVEQNAVLRIMRQEVIKPW